jgi:hypothetical protein
MPDITLDRGDTVLAICTYLRNNVTDLNLVKPYEGELDRYSKKTQLRNELFPAQVNLQTPFALVISKARENIDNNGRNQGLRLKHNISIYVGVASSYDFSSQTAPSAFTLLKKTAQALHNRKIVENAVGVLTLVDDGEYLIRTELFTVYDQKFYQLEVGY